MPPPGIAHENLSDEGDPVGTSAAAEQPLPTVALEARDVWP
jgi:hypothetical protein